MTNQQIRIVIGENFGIVKLPYSHSLGVIAMTAEYVVIPDYCNDHKAMDKVEETLSSNEWERWHRIVGDWEIVVSQLTPRQRAEAFLKTIGKWNDQ